jgi:phage protein D
MLTPAYKLTIGKKRVDTTKEPKASTAVELRVELDLDTPADRFVAELGQVNGLKPAPDDDVTVELGYADNGGFTQVMAGKVVTVEPGITRNRVIAHTPAQALLRSFTEKTFESKTAGAIVQDLCKQAAVTVASADDGITFPAYVIDGRRSFQRHIADLAELCGFDVYFNAQGKLVFEKFINGKAVHVFEFAKHVLELKVKRAPAFASSVLAFGESPAGNQSADAWPWLTKDFSGSKGSAGTGSPARLVEHPVLRTHDAAQTAADAAQIRQQRRALEGQVWTIGRPQVQLGDAVRFASVPDDSLNKNFQVRSVTHAIDKTGGFTTRVGFRAIQCGCNMSLMTGDRLRP